MVSQNLMSELTASGNTLSNSHLGFSTTVDWLDLMVRDIRGVNELADFLQCLSIVLNDELFIPNGNGRFLGHSWMHSDRTDGGITLDYIPPVTELYYPVNDHPDMREFRDALERVLPLPGTCVSPEQLKNLAALGNGYFELYYGQQPVSARLHRPLLVSKSSPLITGFEWRKISTPVIVRAGKMRISISGTSMARADLPALFTFLAIQQDTFKIEASRCDLALDDRDRFTKREYLIAAVDAGNYSGADTALPFEPRNRGKIEGWSYYFGSRTSDSMLRIYDKLYESKGENKSIRWELQLRRKLADEAFQKLLLFSDGKPKDMAKFIAATVLGKISFIDRSTGDKNLERCSILPWFQQLIERTTLPIKLRVPREKTTLQKSINHVDKSASKTLGKFAKKMGIAAVASWAVAMANAGMSRLTPSDMRELEYVQSEELIYQPEDIRDWRESERKAMFLAVNQPDTPVPISG